MSVCDEGATHYYGDDCPGGHRAASTHSFATTQIATPDLTRGVAMPADQLTADEANERDRRDEETLLMAWDAVVALLTNGAAKARQQRLSPDYVEGWTDAAAVIAETVAEMRAKRSDAKEADGDR